MVNPEKLAYEAGEAIRKVVLEREYWRTGGRISLQIDILDPPSAEAEPICDNAGEQDAKESSSRMEPLECSGASKSQKRSFPIEESAIEQPMETVQKKKATIENRLSHHNPHRSKFLDESLSSDSEEEQVDSQEAFRRFRGRPILYEDVPPIPPNPLYRPDSPGSPRIMDRVRRSELAPENRSIGRTPMPFYDGSSGPGKKPMALTLTIDLVDHLKAEYKKLDKPARKHVCMQLQQHPSVCSFCKKKLKNPSKFLKHVLEKEHIEKATNEGVHFAYAGDYQRLVEVFEKAKEETKSSNSRSE